MKGKLVQELHPAWKGEQAKQSAKHNWLQRHYPKSGICEDCGQRRLTHYSFLHHPGPYTRRREDDRRALCSLPHPGRQRPAEEALHQEARASSLSLSGHLLPVVVPSIQASFPHLAHRTKEYPRWPTMPKNARAPGDRSSAGDD